MHSFRSLLIMGAFSPTNLYCLKGIHNQGTIVEFIVLGFISALKMLDAGVAEPSKDYVCELHEEFVLGECQRQITRPHENMKFTWTTIECHQ